MSGDYEYKVGDWVEACDGYRAGEAAQITHAMRSQWSGIPMYEIEGVAGAFYSDELQAAENPADSVAVALDPSDPFDAALIDIVKLNRSKRGDYAKDGDIFSNFRDAGRTCGLDAGKIVDVMLGIKAARLVALEQNNREPNNESVLDTILDRAVYGIIGYAIAKETTSEEG